jgi:hypothetical protein
LFVDGAEDGGEVGNAENENVGAIVVIVCEHVGTIELGEKGLLVESVDKTVGEDVGNADGKQFG